MLLSSFGGHDTINGFGTSRECCHICSKIKQFTLFNKLPNECTVLEVSWLCTRSLDKIILNQFHLSPGSLIKKKLTLEMLKRIPWQQKVENES
jgi:hypothetical protein